MRAEARFWKLAGLLATLLTMAVPAYIAYDLYHPPPDAEKRVELISPGPIDPLRDLSALRDKATIYVTVENETLNNLVIAQGFFMNTGTVPILPSDYHQNLSVSVHSPWKIVAVENQRHYGTQRVALDWIRITDKRFEAEPALLNPGDRIAVSVYLTKTEESGTSASTEGADPTIEWDARITNLRGFSKRPDALEELDQLSRKYGAFPPIVVHLQGWAVVFTIGAALVFQTFYVHMLIGSDLLREWTWKSLALVVCTSFISFAAAESMATYLFDSIVTSFSGTNHWLNAPPIILHGTFLAFLWWRTWRSSEKTPLHAG